MTYVMSDIHGQSEKYNLMLEKISLCETDKLYILGDVIDGGDGGISVLLSMMKKRNIIPIIGNHEYLALPVLKAIASGVPLNEVKKTKAYRTWAINGGAVTASAFNTLNKNMQLETLEYIRSFSIYEEVEISGRKYHLSHTLPSYDPDRDIHDVSCRDFIWGEPDYEKKYDKDIIFITGHTPTDLIDPAFPGRIWQGNGHIAVDCGAMYEGGRLGCICLDTMEEYYV